eukprot:TRINITY_DN26085_c0_g1_i1.p1 TRINITY_DN26085_c0_g1~~TRINITY_DN26085_c0_g1_i1.p1  ORF type:complete len:171 (+),score=14.88 TRINITY_DN26085_c0_g1_i1:311-823(+)
MNTFELSSGDCLKKIPKALRRQEKCNLSTLLDSPPRDQPYKYSIFQGFENYKILPSRRQVLKNLPQNLWNSFLQKGTTPFTFVHSTKRHHPLCIIELYKGVLSPSDKESPPGWGDVPQGFAPSKHKALLKIIVPLGRCFAIFKSKTNRIFRKKDSSHVGTSFMQCSKNIS